MKYTYKEIKQAQTSNLWTIGNEFLYEMCKKYPMHNDKAVFLSKIWLIGRSYSASIERRKQNNKITNDEFYEHVIGKGILKVGSKIDEYIKLLNSHKKISHENNAEILELHHLLTQTFESLTGMSKRSLASKYLHFHLPQLFYIYDSRAKNAINEIFRNDDLLRQRLKSLSTTMRYDDEYTKFFNKMFLLNQEIERQHAIWLSPRELDNLLLKFNEV